MEQYELWLKALAKKREPAIDEASRLADLEQFKDAEAAVKRVDDSIYGAVALGKMYRAKLEAIVASGAAGTREGKPKAERLFERALWCMQSAYPEPHTAMEGDNYERGRAEDLDCLVRILGYDPGSGARR